MEPSTTSDPTPARPLVSVILPTHDRLEYLRAAIDSVRAQSYAAWELIVGDDGSADGTAPYVRALDDPRVRLVALEHSGLPARVRNAALREAAGEYVAFLDSDDGWEPRKLEVQLARLRAAEPAAGWSYTAVTRMDAAGAPVSMEGTQPWRALSGRILPELLRLDAIVPMPTVLARRSLVEAAGGFDESLPFCEDYDLWFRVARLAEAVAVPEPLSRVRVHPANYSRDRIGVHRSWVRVYRKAAAAADSGDERRICRRRLTYHGAALARLQLAAGRRTESARTLAGLLARDPLAGEAWRAAARWCVPRGTALLAGASLLLLQGCAPVETRALQESLREDLGAEVHVSVGTTRGFRELRITVPDRPPQARQDELDDAMALATTALERYEGAADRVTIRFEYRDEASILHAREYRLPVSPDGRRIITPPIP